MEGAFFGKEVISLKKEKDFYKEVKNYITGLNSLITCANDPDEEFDTSEVGSSHIPILEFKVDGTDLFKLYRDSTLSVTSNTSFYVSMNNVPTGIPESTKWMSFKESSISEGVPYTSDFKRGVLISHIVNDNFIYLMFTPLWNYSDNRKNNFRVLYCKSGDDIYVTSSNTLLSAWDKSNAFNISGLTLYDLATPTSNGTFLSRFSYAAPAGSIDYIKSSIYQSGNIRSFENMAIYDCTTVTTGDTVSLKDGAYVAVGPHQLVKVS